MLRKPCLNGLKSNFCGILGAQWGDEGKGKLIDVLSQNYDVVARFNGGSNAGHTIKCDGHKYFCHIIPSGIVRPHIVNIIGNGCVVNLDFLFKELKQLADNNLDFKNRLFISSKANLTLNGHLMVEKKLEKSQNIGTTLKGIGTTYAFKCLRFNLRFEDILLPEDELLKKYNYFYQNIRDLFNLENSNPNEFEQLLEYKKILVDNCMIIDSSRYINNAIKNGERVLAEGANGALLDIDHGSYPYVTSSNTCAGSIATGLGVSPLKIETLIGVVKAYTTRVGGGYMDTELISETGEKLQRIGGEIGVTTGRKRRCGWLDLVNLKKSVESNGYNSLNITKIDVLDTFEKIKARVNDNEYKEFNGWMTDITNIKDYKDMPVELKKYVSFIEEYLETPVSWLGNGPDREQMLQLI